MEKSKNKRPHRGRHPVKGKSQGGKSKKGFPKKNKVTKTQKEEQEIILLQEKYKKVFMFYLNDKHFYSLDKVHECFKEKYP
jgi:hypothetical protein